MENKMENEMFGDWRKNTSRFFPTGAVILVENGEDVVLTIFEQGQREKVSCKIGKTLDVIFDEAGKRRTQFELMKEIDRVAFYEHNIEVDFYDYIVDEELTDMYDAAEGLTRDEYLAKLEKESIEEDLINAPVD